MIYLHMFYFFNKNNNSDKGWTVETHRVDDYST